MPAIVARRSGRGNGDKVGMRVERTQELETRGEKMREFENEGEDARQVEGERRQLRGRTSCEGRARQRQG